MLGQLLSALGGLEGWLLSQLQGFLFHVRAEALLYLISAFLCAGDFKHVSPAEITQREGVSGVAAPHTRGPLTREGRGKNRVEGIFPKLREA